MNSVNFIPLSSNHFSLLLSWLNSPHLQASWNEGISWTPELIEKKYASYVYGYKIENNIQKPIHAFIITIDKHPIGYIQYYNAYDFTRECDDVLKELPQPLSALDIFIGEESALGKGLGTLILQQFLEQFIDPHFEACFVDPDTTNTRAIHAYEKVGFKKIKTINNGTITYMIRKKSEL